MLIRKLVEKIGSLLKEQPAFDASKFGDPIAEKTAWTPARGGGSSFCTRRLKAVGYHAIKFRPTIGAILFYLVFFFAGLATVFFIFASREAKDTLDFNLEVLGPIAIGLVFIIAGGLMFYFGINPIIFDRAAGYFWKGRKKPENISDPSSLKACTELGRIHALQIVSELCRSSKNSYWSYELNLVLDDATRINVVDHGSLSKLRADAAVLSEFLGVPIWDAA